MISFLSPLSITAIYFSEKNLFLSTNFYLKIYFGENLHKVRSSVSQWLGRSPAVLGVDGSSLLTASVKPSIAIIQRCDGLNSPYAC